jgi:hypothetical protein
MYSYDRRHHSRRGSLTVVLVVSDKKPDLECARARIPKELNALARRELSLLMEPFQPVRSARLAELSLERSYLIAQLAEAVAH